MLHEHEGGVLASKDEKKGKWLRIMSARRALVTTVVKSEERRLILPCWVCARTIDLCRIEMK